MAFINVIWKWLTRVWGMGTEVWKLNQRVKAIEENDKTPPQHADAQLCPSCGYQMRVVKTQPYEYPFGRTMKISNEFQWSYFQCRQDCYHNKTLLRVRTRGVSVL